VVTADTSRMAAIRLTLIVSKFIIVTGHLQKFCEVNAGKDDTT